MPHASCLMPQFSRFLSCLMPHASVFSFSLMPHASCLMPHASCLSFLVFLILNWPYTTTVVHLQTCLKLEFLFCHQSPNPAVQVTLALKGSRKSAQPQWHHKEDLPRSIFPHSQSHMGAMYDCISPANFTATVQVTRLWDPPQGINVGCACNLAMCEDSYRLVSCMSREMSKHFAKHSKKI
jgi:hypothetical protein